MFKFITKRIRGVAFGVVVILVSLIAPRFVGVILKEETPFWTSTTYKGAFPVTDGTPATDWTDGWSNFDPENASYPSTTSVLNSDITTNTILSGTILLQNKVYVKNGATLTILPGTVIRGDYQTQGTLIITKGSKLIADGEQFNPIVRTVDEVNKTWKSPT